MERILIVGCPGAGKSTAARRLAGITQLPLVHLDLHYWHPGRVPTEKDAWRTKVQELVSQPRWIIDGNYGGTLDLQLASADTLIHLDFLTWICVWRVGCRTLTGLGRQRGQEFCEGCPERFDWAFFRFVLDYRRKYRAREIARMAAFEGVTHRFT